MITSVRYSRFWLLCALAAMVVISLWFARAVHAQCHEDRDCDGVLDSVDRCPDQAGPVDNGGCPVAEPDSDGDGVPDSVDRCPREAGPRENGGCPRPAEPLPDSDGDGVPDSVDRCPREAGPRENGGCPLPPESPPDSPRGGDGGDTGAPPVEADQVPPAPDIPAEPALLLPALPEDGPCVVATQGMDGVNVRASPDTSQAIFVLRTLDPALFYPVVMSFQTPEGTWWMLEQGGFVAGWVTRQGGDCANTWTLLGDGSVRFLSDSVSGTSWSTNQGWGRWEITPGRLAATQSSPQLAQVVSIGGQPIATIGGSQAFTVGGSQADAVPMEQFSFTYGRIEWYYPILPYIEQSPLYGDDLDPPIILGSVYNPDDAAASGDLASADCPLLPEMEGVTCQPGQPYFEVKMKQVLVTGYTASGDEDSAADTIPALGVMNTPLIVVPEVFQPGGSEPLPAVTGDLNAFQFTDATISWFAPGGAEFQDNWDAQPTVMDDPPVVIGLPSAASGRGPSLLIGGAGRDLLLGGDGNDVLLYALQLFALVDDTGAFRLFDTDDQALLEGATLVHMAEIVVAGGDEDVLVVAAQPAPDQLTIRVEPPNSDTILLVNGGGNHPN